MLELYQIDGCPFCTRVRGCLDRLGLDLPERLRIPSPLLETASV